MGLSLSLLNKLGVPGVSSLTTDQFYERFFKDKNIKDFKDFHIAFIDLCKSINDVLPGKHFTAPTTKEIEKFYEDWKKTEEPQGREKLIEFVKDNVKRSRTEHDSTVIITGMVAPPAAVVLKNYTENIPQVKRFKLHLIPNFVFVPTFTFLAITGVQLMQASKKSKQALPSQGDHPGSQN